jgi:hypothetical protein
MVSILSGSGQPYIHEKGWQNQATYVFCVTRISCPKPESNYVVLNTELDLNAEPNLSTTPDT